MSARAAWVALFVVVVVGGSGCARSASPPAAALTRDDLRASSPGTSQVRGTPPASELRSTSPPAADMTGVLLAEAAPEPEQPEAPQAEPEPQQPPEQAVADAPDGGPLLIYEADVNLAVHEVREKIDRVIAIADDTDGFIQAQDDTGVIIRVPAARFRDALEQVEALGDLLHRRISAEDVSDQVREVRIRLDNALEMRDRLAELLARAETVPESLTIEQELERLTESIESLRGQLRSLQDRIAYSIITVRFQPVSMAQEVPNERFRLPFRWLQELGLVNLLRL